MFDRIKHYRIAENAYNIQNLPWADAIGVEEVEYRELADIGKPNREVLAVPAVVCWFTRGPGQEELARLLVDTLNRVSLRKAAARPMSAMEINCRLTIVRAMLKRLTRKRGKHFDSEMYLWAMAEQGNLTTRLGIAFYRAMSLSQLCDGQNGATERGAVDPGRNSADAADPAARGQ